MNLRELPPRAATGAFVLHSGLDKWHGDEGTADAIHALAVGAYPVLGRLSSRHFLRLLAAGEIAVGSALLTPVVPTAVAGAALAGFSGALLGMYARTPQLRKPGSVWPTPQGVAISKDVWMFGIGLGLLADAWSMRSGRSIAGGPNI
ncbi:putative membrane protein YphA (DoxX/SURF4 family) [Streptacidiphilus sp. MAP12-16]|jgi:uncharacterized membrane protein YphA (DoxX/SURF4 family)|uniref:hypothetical protein n=1 Tax=Streptacidiphilus sp. MAP12-16 TaxID=3156300 RepID=UPI0035139AE9